VSASPSALLASEHLRLRDVAEPGLSDEPFPGSFFSTFLQHVVHSCGAVRARSTSSADWYSAVRFGRMVFIELSSEVRQLRRRHGFSLGACPSDHSVSNDLHRLRTGMLVPHPPYADESASVRQEGGTLGVVTRT
jgi:hypothetical protein